VFCRCRRRSLPGLLSRCGRLFVLERAHISHSGLVDQILEQTAILDRLADLGYQPLGDINREPSRASAHIERVAAMSLPGGARRAVFANARAFSQRERACRYRPDAANGFRKPLFDVRRALDIRHWLICAIMHVYKQKSTILFRHRWFLERCNWQDYASTWGFWQDYRSRGVTGEARAGAKPRASRRYSGKTMVPNRQNYGSRHTIITAGPPVVSLFNGNSPVAAWLARQQTSAHGKGQQ